MKALLQRRRSLYGAGLLAGVALLAFALVARPRPRPAPLEVSFWYWHRPFALSAAELAQLREMGVKHLFVRAATLAGAGRPRPVLEQEWRSRGEGLTVTLVLNAAPDVVRAFAGADTAALASSISEAANREVERATAAGVRVAGVQLDCDCPTRLLPRYAAMLERVRAGLRPAGQRLGVTALPTWLGDRGIETVARAVDYLAPQFYEGDIPRRVGVCTPISSAHRLVRGLEAAGRLGVPFYAGVPAYGHALVYSGQGSLLGTYHDMTVTEAMRHPSLRLLSQYPSDGDGRPASSASYIGEDVTVLAPRDVRAVDPEHALEGRPDHGMGRAPYYLRYQLPSAVMVARQVAIVRSRRPASCRGIILYRFPQQGDASALPLPSIAAALAGRGLVPHLRVRVAESSSPWEAIDTGTRSAEMPRTLEMDVINDGTAGAYVAPGAVTVTVRLNRPGVDRAPPGSFDSVEGYYGSTPQGALRSSLRRANVLVFRASRLDAGQTLRLGPISMPPGGPDVVRLEWSVRGPGGFTVESGVVPEYRVGGAA